MDEKARSMSEANHAVDEAKGAGYRVIVDARQLEAEERYVASLHLRPGDEVPADWEICPLCRGGGCPHCDDSGWVHPVRVEWLEDWLLSLWDPVLLLEECWLADPQLPHRSRRWVEWLAARSRPAQQLIERWAEEDGHPGDTWRGGFVTEEVASGDEPSPEQEGVSA